MKATCAGCGAEGDLKLAPTDKTSVIGGPNGWGTVQVDGAGARTESRRVCSKCMKKVRRVLRLDRSN